MIHMVLAGLLLLAGLAGEWRSVEDDGEETLILREDGKGELDGIRLAWRAEGSELVVRFEGVPIEVRYKYRMSGDALWIQDEEGESSAYERVRRTPASPPAPPAGRPAGSSLDPGASPAPGAAKGEAYDHARVFGCDLPPGWKVQAATHDLAPLVPPDLALGLEGYAVATRPLSGAPSVRDPRAAAFFDEQAVQLLPTLTRKAGPEPIAEGDGARYVYEGPNLEGKTVRALVLARAVGTDAVWVGALGLKEKVEAREPTLLAIYRTLRPRSAAAQATDAAAGPHPAWLVGSWSSHERTGDLSGATRDSTLGADGSFQYHYLWIMKTINGGVNTSQEIWRGGRWSYAGGVLTVEFDPAQDRWQWPPKPDSPHAQPRWDIPCTQGVDPQSGRPALIGADGSVIAVKQR